MNESIWKLQSNEDSKTLCVIEVSMGTSVTFPIDLRALHSVKPSVPMFPSYLTCA